MWVKINGFFPLIACWKDGSTALFKAAHNGHCNVIEELLKFNPSLGLLKVGKKFLYMSYIHSHYMEHLVGLLH